MTLQTAQQIITIYCPISQEVSFLKKSYIKCGGEASPRPFHKKSKLSIQGIN